MKIILVNGSPNENGCTQTALAEIARTLDEEGIGSEFFHIGTKPIFGCLACYKCQKLGQCVISDRVNDFLAMAKDADGFVFGSPVHFASAGGAITAFMDRAFFADRSSRKQAFYLKPAAAVTAARRAGTTATLDQLNKYFTISEMLVISSQYWNMVHGLTPEDVEKDLEGLQIMRTLGRNMAWFLKCKEAGIKSGVPFPELEKRIATNYIR